MTVHELKTWPEAYEQLIEGGKTHEYRKDDRDFQVGDELLLQEWDPSEEAYSGSEMLFQVTSITRGPDYGIPEGFCVMSIKKPPGSPFAELIHGLLETDGLSNEEKKALAEFQVRKAELLQDKATAMLNRVKILRNMYHQKQQECLQKALRLAQVTGEDTTVRDLAVANARGRGAHWGDALQLLYQEFPELDQLEGEIRPRCPICGDEVPDLIAHSRKHRKVRDEIRKGASVKE